MHENNCVEITGLIISDFKFVYKRNGETFYTIDLKCKRISGGSDILKLLVSDYYIYTDKSLEGLYCSCLGKMRTYNNKTNDKVKLDTYIYVDDMEIINVECNDDEEIIDINNVELVGSICSIKPIRRTPLGRIICNTIIAINDNNSSQYIPCIFWGRKAEKISMFDVGTSINLKGRFQSRPYKKKIEEKEIDKVAYEISVQDFTVLV